MATVPCAIRSPEIKFTKLFINNEWTPSLDGSSFTVANPATSDVICQVSEAKQADVDKAVFAATEAFKVGSKWRQMVPSNRSKLLNNLADLIERDRLYIASLETLNNGKVFKRVYERDLPMVIHTFRYYAGWTDKHHGKTIPIDGDYMVYTTREPVGVCGAIIPWNVPLIMLAWKVAPCLAMGNTLVLKPSEVTPLTALYVASLVVEAGFPPGVLNVVPGFGAEAGSALSHHMDIMKLSFTGSVNTGRLIQKASADSNFKNLTLELGGKSPLIIFPDVDLDVAVGAAGVAIFTQAGQICCAGSRTFVHEDIFDEFVGKSVERAKMKKIGDPMDVDTDHGPQINKHQQDRILAMIEQGVKDGCTLLCGGKKVEGLKGHYVQPTVMIGMSDHMEIARQEIFGPVQLIFKFKTIAEVIERSNASQYGLIAGVFTNNINNAMTVARCARAGTVWVNCFFALNANAPFGGYKQSGSGRDLGEEALDAYTEVKTVYIKTPPLV
ncbi:retinal dehydrogenase 2-like [Ciona intestinalis]